MKKNVLMALVGLAGVASAANAGVTASLTKSNDLSPGTPTATITLVGQATGTVFGLANLGGNGSVVAFTYTDSQLAANTISRTTYSDYGTIFGDSTASSGGYGGGVVNNQTGLRFPYRDLINPNGGGGTGDADNARNGNSSDYGAGKASLSGVQGSQNAGTASGQHAIWSNTGTGLKDPQKVFSFNYTTGNFTARNVVVNFTGRGREYNNDQGTNSSAVNNLSASVTLAVTPAPGAAALLGLGGLVAGRRRRA
ncbi:MAG: hypothetical protein JNM07_00380 [Phycisphaerae bacterium]|nr:hypothetical protein [Phycisphaerae bacterium]